MDDSNDPPPSASDGNDGGAGLPQPGMVDDDLFDALAHHRRRYLLFSLLEEEAWSLHDLAGKLAAWENGEPEGDIDEEEVERAYVSLYHAHVPKLADLGILEFCRQEELITKGPNAKPALNALEYTGSSDAEQLERHARKNLNDR